jgi:anti-anti-sigma factor
MDPPAVAWHDCIATLLHESRLSPPSSLVDVINESMRPVGAEVAVYLVDREQLALRALPRTGVAVPDPIPIDTTLVGRAFTTAQLVTPAANGADRLWLPLRNGTDRLGVMEVVLPDSQAADEPPVREGAELLATVVGYLLASKILHGDTIRLTRRSQPMSAGGELLWRALPPLTCATRDVVLAAALEPCYDVGGDAFDYAIDHDQLRIAIFDAVGHGLAAALTSTLTLAATRAARAARLDLTATAAAGDEAITGQFGDLRYTTAILAELDLATGVLRYLNAGHPPAVLVRDGKVVVTLDAVGRTPLGLPDWVEAAEETLEPGDRLLFYTDGITEARDSDGKFFGLTRLIDLTERHSAAGLSVPETLRRLSHAVLDHQQGRLDDDATLMIVEWSPQARPAEPARTREEASPASVPHEDAGSQGDAAEILTFTTDSTAAPDVIVVRPSGVIGLAGAVHLERGLLEHVERGASKLVLDASGVSLVDSAGLTALLRAHRGAAAHDGWLRLVNPRPRVRRIVETTNLTSVISIYDSIEEAMAGS